MVHCGFEPTAVDQTFRSLEAMGSTLSSMLTGRP
jgi:hypothetical protein